MAKQTPTPNSYDLQSPNADGEDDFGFDLTALSDFANEAPAPAPDPQKAEIEKQTSEVPRNTSNKQPKDTKPTKTQTSTKNKAAEIDTTTTTKISTNTISSNTQLPTDNASNVVEAPVKKQRVSKIQKEKNITSKEIKEATRGKRTRRTVLSEHIPKMVRIEKRYVNRIQEAADMLQRAEPGKGNFSKMLRLILRDYFEPRA